MEVKSLILHGHSEEHTSPIKLIFPGDNCEGLECVQTQPVREVIAFSQPKVSILKESLSVMSFYIYF